MRHSSRPRSWLAVKGKLPEAIHSELHLTATRYSGDDKLKFKIVGASSDAGWYLIVARDREHRLISEPVVKSLSVRCEVLTCTMDEQNNFSAATGWQDGRRVWSISYNGEEGPADIVADGDLPISFSTIRQRYTAEAQAEDAGDALVDPMFEIAIEVVHSVIGYRPGDSSPQFVGRFKLLESTDESWFQRNFST